MAALESKPGIVYWLYDDQCICLWRHGYIGTSQEWRGRLKNHRKRFRDCNFKTKILFEGPMLECRKLEYVLRPQRKIGWNIGVGGGKSRFGVSCTESTKQKLREARLLQAPLSESAREKMRVASTGRTNRGRVGQRKSAEERAKISASHTGKKMSAGAIAKIAASKIGNQNRLGAKLSEQSRLQISMKKRGISIHSEEHKQKLAARWRGNSLTKGEPWSAARRLAQLKRKERSNADLFQSDQLGLFAE